VAARYLCLCGMTPERTFLDNDFVLPQEDGNRCSTSTERQGEPYICTCTFNSALTQLQKQPYPKPFLMRMGLFSYSFYISSGSSLYLIGKKPCMFCKEARVCMYFPSWRRRQGDCSILHISAYHIYGKRSPESSEKRQIFFIYFS